MVESKTQNQEFGHHLKLETMHEQYGILVVVTQPSGSLESIGLTDYTEWFAEALAIDRKRISAINAIEEPLPSTVPHSGIIIGGSSHSIYESLPWMQRLQEFIRAMAEQEKPMLGVCFGHQAIAMAFGGTVEKGVHGRELGATEIELTPEGRQDRLFEDLPARLTIATSHADALTALPHTGNVTVLANNKTYPYQALAVGNNIRTIQPHPEITCDILTTLAQARKDTLIQEGFVKDDAAFETFILSCEYLVSLLRG